MTSMAGVVHSDSRVMDLIDSSIGRIYGSTAGVGDSALQSASWSHASCSWIQVCLIPRLVQKVADGEGKACNEKRPHHLMPCNPSNSVWIRAAVAAGTHKASGNRGLSMAKDLQWARCCEDTSWCISSFSCLLWEVVHCENVTRIKNSGLEAVVEVQVPINFPR
jgi:hypothetical protein